MAYPDEVAVPDPINPPINKPVPAPIAAPRPPPKAAPAAAPNPAAIILSVVVDEVMYLTHRMPGPASDDGIKKQAEDVERNFMPYVGVLLLRN